MFVGREEELKELKVNYQSDDTRIISVLGRRRIGKSQLIFHSYQDFDGLVIAYECSATSYYDNLVSITKLIQGSFNNKYLSFSSLYDVLLFLQDEAKKQKIIFIIDEYPYMREGKATDSEIKNAIDKFDELEKKNPLKFILCGSAVETMNILDDVNMPLHGRFNSIIYLYPLDYLQSSLFYKDASYEDKVKYYSIFGGVPYFLKQINPQQTFNENIIRLFFSSNALLKAELENQINGEINKVEKASLILNILQNKTLSYTDVFQAFKNSYPDGQIDYSLNKLIKMQIVKKIFIEQNNGKNKPYYCIANNSILFYFMFLLKPFANRLLFTDEDYYHTFVEHRLLIDFVPHVFENICFQFVSIMNKKHLLPYQLYDLSPYIINDRQTKKNYQFDVVGKTKDGLINFECKFQSSEIKANKVFQEERQAELANSNFIKTIFISKSPVLGSSNVYYLEDLFNDELLK